MGNTYSCSTQLNIMKYLEPYRRFLGFVKEIENVVSKDRLLFIQKVCRFFPGGKVKCFETFDAFYNTYVNDYGVEIANKLLTYDVIQIFLTHQPNEIDQICNLIATVFYSSNRFY